MTGTPPIAAAIAAIVLIAAIHLHAGQPAKPTEAGERARFVGLWKGFTVEGAGERPDRGPVQLELIITERTIHGIQIKGDEREDHGQGQYTLELGENPRQLDASQTNERGRVRAYVGIYELEGDTLKWCVSPQKVRPTTFETRKGQFLLILKRDPAGPPRQ
jgi:uncharacterized protein (TIGR03067 family)